MLNKKKNETTVYVVFKDANFIQDYCKYIYGHTCTSLHVPCIPVLENINKVNKEIKNTCVSFGNQCH